MDRRKFLVSTGSVLGASTLSITQLNQPAIAVTFDSFDTSSEAFVDNLSSSSLVVVFKDVVINTTDITGDEPIVLNIYPKKDGNDADFSTPIETYKFEPSGSDKIQLDSLTVTVPESVTDNATDQFSIVFEVSHPAVDPATSTARIARDAGGVLRLIITKSKNRDITGTYPGPKDDSGNKTQSESLDITNQKNQDILTSKPEVLK